LNPQRRQKLLSLAFFCPQLGQNTKPGMPFWGFFSAAALSATALSAMVFSAAAFSAAAFSAATLSAAAFSAVGGWHR